MKKHKNSISPKTLSRGVSNNLIRLILNGTYPAGSKLPTERDMAEKYRVARHIVREALKRLDTLNLIVIRQGSGAVVQDVSQSAGIELIDFFLINEDESINKELFNDMMEFHQLTVVYASRLAAQRITPEELQELKRLMNERTRCVGDAQKDFAITVLVNRLIAKACRNMYIQLLFNSLIYTATFETMLGTPVPAERDGQLYTEKLIEAFENKDPEMAALLTERVIRKNKNYLIKKLKNMQL
jgi:GntR family transcriptional regulator, transcriptional repressor for pyruvate dehydrogenase complex